MGREEKRRLVEVRSEKREREWDKERKREMTECLTLHVI